MKWQPGDRLIDAINRAGIPLSQVCYLPILGPIQTCDTCIVEVGWQAGPRLRYGDVCRNEGLHHGGPRASRPHRSVRPHSARSRALLHGLRQQQRQLHGPQHHQTARASSTSVTRFRRSRTRSTIAIRSIVTIPISASCAADAWRPARICKSTRRCPSAGKIRIRACCGMAARRSANRAASPAAIA